MMRLKGCAIFKNILTFSHLKFSRGKEKGSDKHFTFLLHILLIFKTIGIVNVIIFIMSIVWFNYFINVLIAIKMKLFA